MSKNIKIIPTAEYDEIVRVVQMYYVEGLKLGDWKTISKAFHPEATMYGWTSTGGPLLGGPATNLESYVEEHGAGPNMESRIDIIAITPTTACVRVDLENDAGGFDYTDFHTMFKTDGQWQIIAKVFHKYD